MNILKENDFEKLTSFINEKSGIKIQKSKFHPMKHKIEKLIVKHNFKTFQEFFQTIKLGVNFEIFQELLNNITVNETYFYRENQHFKVLVENIFPTLDKIKKPNEHLRILCAPCSSGEEPYTIALYSLTQSNILHKRDIEIIVIDIDSNAIEKGKNGLYSQRSVQLLPQNVLNNYFSKSGDLYQIDESLQRAIDFKTINIFDNESMKTIGTFDIIFSRNMLIYFDQDSKKRAGEIFYKILNTEGFLFLGHTDTLEQASILFKTQKWNDTLFYKKCHQE